ncbi:hypothetical protein HMPREF1250_2185 [Megasphaera vaginalis (ex Srinivasan et al. 2021)]|uniref:Uncharacterized protein n=1 Tax=Megasphaera vaginalis (ex Srinivasan et al. 2021) TaxID=1111454 RepID=U7USB5_9FIRM|nr:hypothetical protein HMPREF1250_2185 [Megasphaera vaginalis (ex Srinivasan et al. 2021)]
MYRSVGKRFCFLAAGGREGVTGKAAAMRCFFTCRELDVGCNRGE